jgi:hypothetical protein
MRSPRSYNARKSVMPGALNNSLISSFGSPNASKRKGEKVSQSLNTYKKTGVVYTKCYQMLCGNCAKRFTKVMVVDQTSSPSDAEQNVFDVQALFNSSKSKFYSI